MAQASYTHEQQESLLWHSGELITPEDLNDQQRLAERRMLDHALRGLLLEAGDFDATGPFDPWLRPMGRALSIEQNSPTGLSVLVRPGTILWRAGSDPGQPDPHWRMHYLPSTVVVTVDSADGTNPRIDALSAKVEYDAEDTVSGPNLETRVIKSAGEVFSSQGMDKRRRTLLTITYTPGTPAASPVAPATPAGQVKFAEIRVNAGETAIVTTRVADHRTPAGMTRVALFGREAFFTTFAGVGSVPSQIRASAAGQDAYWHLNTQGSMVEPPRSSSSFALTFPPRHLRLRRLAWQGNITGAGTITLMTAFFQTVQSIANSPDVGNWSIDTPARPIWIDSLTVPSTGFQNPLEWLTSFSPKPGLILRIIAGANLNFADAVIADYWGV